MTMRSCVTIIMAGVLAVACGNAAEHLETDDWKPAKMAPLRKSIPAESTVVLSTVEEGSGKVVREGQLVEIVINAKSGSILYPRRQGPTVVPTARAWMLAGSQGNPDRRRVSFGDPALRAGLVGQREGARLMLSNDVKGTDYRPRLPTRGVILKDAYHDDWRQWEPLGSASESEDYDYAALNKSGDYELEIVRACDAVVLERFGVLSQRGARVGWETNPAFARRGDLHWIALEADCGAPAGKIRFEKGPSLIDAWKPGSGKLVRWQESYESQARGWRFWK